LRGVDALIRAAAIVFVLLLLASCVNKPGQLSHKLGPERLALSGIPFLNEEMNGIRSQLFYEGRSGSEIVIVLREKADDATSATETQYKFDLLISDVVTVERYTLQIIKAEEADMMFRVVLN
jgi:hypothetical protein